MKNHFKLPLLALAMLTTLTVQADDTNIMGEDCAADSTCVATVFQEFYSKILPMPITKTITLADFVVKPDIAVANVLLAQKKEDMLLAPGDELALSQTLNAYADNLTCGVDQGIEQIYLKNGGQILWKYFFADGTYFNTYAISSCN
jgi:hypothetical protein